jgi:hypothetical protein
MTSRAVNPPTSAPLSATPRQAMSRSVTMPTSFPFSPTGIAPMSLSRTSARYWIKGLIWLLLRGKLLRGDTFETVQRFYTDGYFHRHFTPDELTHALAPLRVVRVIKTHMSGRMLPLIPRRLDEWAKNHWGWLLIAEVCR